MSVLDERATSNHDLLVAPDDEQWAAENYGSIRHVLVNKELMALFKGHDDIANGLKHGALKTGLIAIFLVSLALAMTVFEPAILERIGDWQWRVLMAVVVFAVGLILSVLVFEGNSLVRKLATLAIALLFAAIIAVQFTTLSFVGEWVTVFSLSWANWNRIAATFGILGFLIATLGALTGDKKREWLCNRLMTERLRQFHFQTFLFRIVLKSDSSTFCEVRDTWFEDFYTRYIGLEATGATEHAKETIRSIAKNWPPQSKIAKTAFRQFYNRYVNLKHLANELEETIHIRPNVWLHSLWLHPTTPTRRGNHFEPLLAAYREGLDENELVQLSHILEAYRELRIGHQSRYANYKVADDRLRFTAPRGQAAILWALSLFCISFICASHTDALIAVFTNPNDQWRIVMLVLLLFLILWRVVPRVLRLTAHPAKKLKYSELLAWVAVFVGSATGMVLESHIAPNSNLRDQFVILVAIMALAARAIEQGLQPEREIERYQQYEWALEDIENRFDDAAVSPTEKLRMMQEMERLSFREMRDFLICNDEAMFVM